MIIEDDKVVSIHYTLKDNEGSAIDSSQGMEPLAYLHGASNIVPGLEKALLGRSVGDKFEVTVEAAEGYGDYVPELRQTVAKELFDGVDSIEVGAQFQANTEQGPLSVIVTEVSGDQITVDGNHPLAGEDLFFEVEVVEIRSASSSEIDHGHVHQGGDCG